MIVINVFILIDVNAGCRQILELPNMPIIQVSLDVDV